MKEAGIMWNDAIDLKPPTGERVVVVGDDMNDGPVIADVAVWLNGRWFCECFEIKVRWWAPLP